MKRTMLLLMVLALLCTTALGLAAQAPEGLDLDLSFEELIERAKAEIGDNTLVVYSPSSRMGKAAADFEAKYGIKVSNTSVKDTEMIPKVVAEITNKVAGGPSLVLAQNGARVQTDLIDTQLVWGWVPVALREVMRKDYQEPLCSWDFPIKVFIYNSGEPWGPEQPFDNVWAFTDAKYRGSFQFKNPTNEAVGMNFLAMVTREDWAQKLAEAYERYYGKPIELTTENAGYEWIKMLYANGMVLGSSDTDMSKAIGARGQDRQLSGLFTLNKVRNAEANELDLLPCYNLDPFSGFYYPIYFMIPVTSSYPYAAMAFQSYMLTAEGYQYWQKELGDYSPNPELVNLEDSVPWEQWEAMLVREDPAWCADNAWKVEEFILTLE